MNTPLETYFDKIVVLTLARRTDRTNHAASVLKKLGIDTDGWGTRVQWAFGPDRPIDHEGRPNGNLGCTTGHRQILDWIIANNVPRTLVLEDDFDIAYTNPAQAQRAHHNPDFGQPRSTRKGGYSQQVTMQNEHPGGLGAPLFGRRTLPSTPQRAACRPLTSSRSAGCSPHRGHTVSPAPAWR